MNDLDLTEQKVEKGMDIPELEFKNKVKLMARRLLSSKKFLVLAVLFTGYYSMMILQTFMDFTFLNLVNLVLPSFLLYGIWKAHTENKNKYSDTSKGLRVIKGVMTVNLVLIGIALGVLFFSIFVSFVLFLILELMVGLVFYGYFVFRKILDNGIGALERGIRETDYFNKGTVFILISGIILFLDFVLFYSGVMDDYLIQNFPEIAQRMKLSEIEPMAAIIGIIASSINMVFTFFIAYFIKVSQNSLESVHYSESELRKTHFRENENEYDQGTESLKI